MIVTIATFRHNIDRLVNIVPKLLPPSRSVLSSHLLIQWLVYFMPVGFLALIKSSF